MAKICQIFVITKIFGIYFVCAETQIQKNPAHRISLMGWMVEKKGLVLAWIDGTVLLVVVIVKAYVAVGFLESGIDKQLTGTEATTKK